MSFDDLADGALLDIAQVARLAGVSSRTLRHYDAIGLLVPAATRPDGRRLYGRDELLRLQRILVMRSLGLPLERIRTVVDDEADEIAALKRHREDLEREHERLSAVITTVEHTLDHLQKGRTMSTGDVFAGLPGYDGEQQEQYERQARDRWGDDAVDASKQRTAGLSTDQARQVMADHEVIARELAALKARGVPADDERTQAVVARHHAWVSTFWVPDAQAYVGLGALYVDDDRFRANYEQYGAGTAAYLRDAINVYASSQ